MNIFVKKPFLIADIGLNFYDVAQKENISQLDAVKLMIGEAKKCGVDAIKFGLFDEESIFSIDLYDETTSKNNPSNELISDLDEFGKEEYVDLTNFCKEVGIIFLSTPFDFDSVDFIDEFIDYYSISSTDLTNIPLIRYVASKNKPIILSTGASTLREIKNAVNAIENVSTSNIGIMHSVLSFPTYLEDVNLLMIKDLSNQFKDYDIGYSDHAVPDENMFLLTTAFNYGAIILEKHFTLDKSLKGNDHIHSMDPTDVIKFRKNLEFLYKINGYKDKQPLICESFMKKEFRKSIVSARDIKKGEIIKNEDISFKRPGTGVSPEFIDDILEKTANENIPKGSQILFEMLK